MLKQETLKKLVAVAALLGIAISSTSARAQSSPATGTVGIVEYGGTTLVIQVAVPSIGPVNFTAAVNASGCPAANQTLDTLAIWQRMAQGARLSGKKVNVYFTACSSGNFIVGLDLIQ